MVSIVSQHTLSKMLYLLSIIAILSTLLSFTLPYKYYLSIWILITSLGSTTAYIAVGLLIYFFGDFHKAYKVIYSLVFSAWVNDILKSLIALPRPPNPLINVSGYSFPSGHAQTTTTFWSSLSLYYNIYPLAVFSITIILLISVSRVLLGVHTFIDVFAGIGLGFAIASGLLIIFMYCGDRFRTRYMILHILTTVFILISYLVYSSTDLIRFSGFILGLSLHPIIYSKVSDDESIYIKVIKYLITLVLSFILFNVTFNLPLMFISSFLIGFIPPAIKFIRLRLRLS